MKFIEPVKPLIWQYFNAERASTLTDSTDRGQRHRKIMTELWSRFIDAENWIDTPTDNWMEQELYEIGQIWLDQCKSWVEKSEQTNYVHRWTVLKKMILNLAEDERDVECDDLTEYLANFMA